MDTLAWTEGEPERGARIQRTRELRSEVLFPRDEAHPAWARARSRCAVVVQQHKHGTDVAEISCTSSVHGTGKFKLVLY